MVYTIFQFGCSNPPDMNRFGSHTGIHILRIIVGNLASNSNQVTLTGVITNKKTPTHFF